MKVFKNFSVDIGMEFQIKKYVLLMMHKKKPIIIDLNCFSN